MNTPAILKTKEAQWVVLGLIGVVVLYYVGKKIVGAVGDAAGGVVSGNNVITQNQHDFGGEATDAYENKGVLGTLGAAANSASGGLFASWGEWIGGKLADWHDSSQLAQQTQAVNRDQIVTPNFVPDAGVLY